MPTIQYITAFLLLCTICCAQLNSIELLNTGSVQKKYALGITEQKISHRVATSISHNMRENKIGLDMVVSGMHGSFLPWKNESECFTDEEQHKLFGSLADVQVGSNQTRTNAIGTLGFWSYIDGQLKGIRISRILQQSEDSHFRIVAHSQGIRNLIEGLYKFSQMKTSDPTQIRTFQLLLVAPRTTGGYIKRALTNILINNKNIRLNIVIIYTHKDRLGGTGTPRNGGIFGGFESNFDGTYLSPWQLKKPNMNKGPRKKRRMARALKNIEKETEKDIRIRNGEPCLHIECHDLAMLKHDYYSHLAAFPSARTFINQEHNYHISAAAMHFMNTDEILAFSLDHTQDTPVTQ